MASQSVGAEIREWRKALHAQAAYDTVSATAIQSLAVRGGSAGMYAALVFVLVFVGGFSVMAIEMLGGRLLAPYFGSSIYVWGSIISIFMLALSLGYLLGGRLSIHAPSLRRLGVIFLGCALCCLPMVLGADALMQWVFARVYDVRYGSLLAAAGLFFLPTTAMGVISPYAIRLLVLNTEQSGQIAGKLYFTSTAGSALGVLATSFYLVLWFEVNSILLVLAALLAFAGVLAIGLPERHGRLQEYSV